jgi:hypothetical protein
MRPSQILLGQRVYWNDPDADTCSATGTVALVPAIIESDSIIGVALDEGGEVTCLPLEIAKIETSRSLPMQPTHHGLITRIRTFLGKLMGRSSGKKP